MKGEDQLKCGTVWWKEGVRVSVAEQKNNVAIRQVKVKHVTTCTCWTSAADRHTSSAFSVVLWAFAGICMSALSAQGDGTRVEGFCFLHFFYMFCKLFCKLFCYFVRSCVTCGENTSNHQNIIRKMLTLCKSALLTRKPRYMVMARFIPHRLAPETGPREVCRVFCFFLNKQ